MTPDTRSATAATVANYRHADDEVTYFVRGVVARAAPANPTRAKAFLFGAMRLASFGASVGLDLVPEVLLCPSVIERCVLSCAALSPATRRTLRTNLRALARAVLTPGPAPTAPAALSRERAKPPYSAQQLAAYFALARHQPTPARRAHAEGLVALGAGAGLMGADLRYVRGSDVQKRSGGLVVEVRGARPRIVPVLARYHEVLSASARFAGSNFVVGGRDLTRLNVTAPLVLRLSGGTDLPRLETSRLRSTWLAECAQMIGLKSFMDAAGVNYSQRLGDLVATMSAVEEVETVRLLTGPR
jgi:integrase